MGRRVHVFEYDPLALNKHMIQELLFNHSQKRWYSTYWKDQSKIPASSPDRLLPPEQFQALLWVPLEKPHLV